MLLATDTYYKENSAKIVGAFFKWTSKTPIKIITTYCNDVLPYEPGSFYKRELPPIMQLLKEVDLNNLEAIIIDGHCYTNNLKEFGLGAYLSKFLNYAVPIIGVAKNSFHKTEEVTIPILRGKSRKPLYISSVNYDLELAARNVKNMKGNYRIPSILKITDQESRNL